MSISSSPQYGLALHTTTPQLGIALDNFQGDKRFQVWNLGRDLSSLLHLHLKEILSPQAWQDIQWIAVAKGPGGFTGTRIGVVAARTLGQQLDIPVYGISTLAAIAHNKLQNKLAKTEPDSLVAVEMNARRDCLFVAIYQISSEGIWSEYLADTTMTKPEWEQTLASLSRPYRLVKSSDRIADTVVSILSLARDRWQQDLMTQWSEVIPFYGQHPV